MSTIATSHFTTTYHFTSFSPQKSYTPSVTSHLAPTNTFTTQSSTSQVRQTFLSITLSFHHTLNTQSQSHSSLPSFNPILFSSHQYPQSSFTTCHIPYYGRFAFSFYPATTLSGPYSTLHPRFHNSFQHFSNPLPPNPPLPYSFTYLFNPPSFQPPPSVSSLAPSVPFAALYDLTKHSDGPYYAHPLEEFLAHRSVRVTFHLDLKQLVFDHI